MSYVKKTLQEGEEVVVTARISMKPTCVGLLFWEAVLVSVFFIVPESEIAILKNENFNYPNSSNQLIILAMLGLLVFSVFFGFLGTFIRRLAHEMVVTSSRIVHRKGLIFRNTEEMDRGAVESISLSQGMFGRIFNYGNVTVRGRGMGDVEMMSIDGPLKIRNSIQARK